MGQDPLITAGYTGTEGYGITITQSIQGTLSNVNINNLETHYGFATGVALFKDSNVQFDRDIVIDNIVAGSKMEMEYLKPQQNYLPNKIPIACSVFNNNYNTQYIMDNIDNIKATNMGGYLICNDDSIIGQCDQETCNSLYDQTYFDQLKTISISSSKSKSKSFTIYATFSKSIIKSPTFAIVAFTVLIIVTLLTCYLWSTSYKLIKDGKGNEINEYNNNEYTPLLK